MFAVKRNPKLMVRAISLINSRRTKKDAAKGGSLELKRRIKKLSKLNIIQITKIVIQIVVPKTRPKGVSLQKLGKKSVSLKKFR